MAAIIPGVDSKLLQELKNRFPEIPEEIVASHMKQHKNDKRKCIDTLERESPNYIFGNTPTVKSIQDFPINPPEGRNRSDSASSGVSSTSSCSVSSVSSSPFGNPNHSSLGMHHPVPDTRPTSDFNQFVSMPGRYAANNPYPNTAYDGNFSVANCNVRPIGGVNTTLPPNHNSGNPAAMRQILVHHVATTPNQVNQFANKTAQTIEIQISPRNVQEPHRQNQQYQPYRTQTSYPGWNKPGSHDISNQGYNNSSGYHSMDVNKQYVVTRRPAPPVPSSQNTLESHSNVPKSLQFTTPQTQHLSSPTNPKAAVRTQQQHSSRATIYLHNSTSCGQLPDGSRDRTPISLPNDFSLHESQSDPYLSGYQNTPASHSNIQSHSVPNNSSPQLAGNSHQQDYNSPLFVDMEHTEPNNVGSPNFNPYLATETGQNSAVNRYLNLTFPVSENSSVNNFGGVVNPPSYIYPASNFGLGGSSQCDNGEQMFINHPPVPNRCSVPGHPPLYVRTNSTESDRRSNPSSGDERHVSTHVVFPNVSPDANSVSCDSSKRRSSGSMQEEAAYTTALLQFQREKMEKLKQDLESELRKLAKTRSEVNQMDKNMMERQRSRHSTFPSIEDVSKLREINRRLQTDIQVMTREIDMFENGQTPLGILDPLEQQNFFKNMNTGQDGSIYTGRPHQTPTRETPPPIPPRTPITAPTVIPPAPPPQPQQDSDGDGEHWNCSVCTFLNHPALNKCETCEMPRSTVAQPETGRVRHTCQNDLCYCHDK